MAEVPAHAVTSLLARVGHGDQRAMDDLFPMVYAELRRIASREMRRERQGRTLQTTALVHEAYLRLVKDASLSAANRGQFLGIAAHAMREILIDRARARVAQKRGGGGARVTLEESLSVTPGLSIDVLALDEALQRLARLDPRHAQVVELRYFGGLSVEDTASAMALSPATVKRIWTMARAWLFRELGGAGETGPGTDE
jgi:RNA polymerase sigma-70 factor, ECF subfamily